MRTPQQIVQAEVCACASYLVSTLAAGAEECADKDLNALAYQALELAAPIEDWEEAAIQAGWEAGSDNRFPISRNRTAIEQAERADNDGPCIYADDFEDACRHDNLDPIQREVFEHWIVTDWFADCLIEQGEKVDKDFAGLCVWARTTTGQAIYADSVVEHIARAHCGWEGDK